MFDVAFKMLGGFICLLLSIIAGLTGAFLWHTWHQALICAFFGAIISWLIIMETTNE